tara:strand:- start:2368 stop:2607 length:240 start_codon:yes stop_codon:yes gene_type:complete
MPKEENQADKQSLEDEQRQLVDIIIGQTEYSREQAIEGLERLKGDYMAVIREYLGTSKKESKPKSLNQQIYSEIRNHLY